MNRRFITLEQLKSVASALLAKINQKPDSSSLSDVSFTGDYNDLSNRPDFSNFVNQTALQNSYEAAMQQVGEHCMVIGRDYVTAGRASGATLGTKATAEGDSTTASDTGAHAEGGKTTASGIYSHAEGIFTTASGPASHTEGFYTTAQRRSQHVFGEYNVLDVTGSTTSDKGTYVEIVGNGTSSTRSNARTLDWSGNEVLAGKLTVGAGPTNNMDVATKQYVDDNALPSTAGVVKYDEALSLTDNEKSQARANIMAGGSNDNLLDNAYFVGGGSQLGDGIFPINQRGQTSYNGGITGFDRWTVDGGDFTATLESGGVRVTSTTQYAGLSQILPAYKLQNGETYTYSIVVDGVLHTKTFVANNDGNWANIYYGPDWYTPYQFINGKWTFKIINTLLSTGMNHLISKVKLEKGTVSTLLNDALPDFGEELRKCQRYLFIRDYAKNDIIANGLTNNLTMFLPVSMRSGGSPIMTFTVTPHVIGNGVISTPTSVNLVSVNGNQVQIYAPTTESHNAQAIVLYAVSATRMTIANEL